MERFWILGAICSAFLIVGAVHTTWQIYKIVGLDARSRGLKHPKLWGLLSASGNNSSGLILYLTGRRKYPVIRQTQEEKREMESRKRRAGVGLVFLAAGGIGLAAIGILLG